MVRGLAAIVIGAILWMVVFYLQVGLLAALWPAFREPGRIWQTQFVFTFSPLMAVALLLFWAVAAFAAGWIAMKIGKAFWSVWVLAGLIGLYLFAMHIVLFWSTFAWWYNVGVVAPAVPAMLLGAGLANLRAPPKGPAQE